MLNGSHRTDDPGIIICKETTAGDEQQTGVERLAAVVLDEGLPVGVIPVLADVLVNFLPQPLPASTGYSRPAVSANLIARSTAYQAENFEYVNC